MHVHKDETKAYGIGPSHLGHLDDERLMGGRELDMKRKAGTGGQRFLADHMTAFLGETRDQSASGNFAAGERQRHLNFIAGTVATLHKCLLIIGPISSNNEFPTMDTPFRFRNQLSSHSVTDSSR